MASSMIRRALLLMMLIVSPSSAGAVFAQESSGPTDFTLTDHRGAPFKLSDHRGKAILLFFGYTSCTEACPMILSRVNSVFKQLGPEREKTLAVFISVDPQRDTPPVLRDYVGYFSSSTVALTGKKEEVDAVVKQYGAKYEIEKSDSALGYHVNHTTDIFLIDPRGVLRSRFSHTERAATMTAEVKRLLR